jgi:cell division protein FtsL
MAAFGLGDNDRMIGFADAQGVAFAAIKGLNAKVSAKDIEIDSLKAEVAELKRAVEVLLTRTSPQGRVAERR